MCQQTNFNDILSQQEDAARNSIRQYPLVPPIGEPSWQQAFLAGYEIGYNDALNVAKGKES